MSVTWLTSRRLLWVLSYSSLVSSSRILASWRLTSDFSTIDCSWNSSCDCREWSCQKNKNAQVTLRSCLRLTHVSDHIRPALCTSLTAWALTSTNPLCTVEDNDWADRRQFRPPANMFWCIWVILWYLVLDLLFFFHGLLHLGL